MYLLDTDVIGNFRRRTPHPELVAWLGSISPDDIAVSVMSVFEIQAGADIVRAADPAKATDIERWLDGVVLASGFELVAIDADIARFYGRMFATPSLRNFILPAPASRRPKSGVDLMIAATAIMRDMTVVTGNTADFRRIHAAFPLPSLYEPFRKEWSIGGPGQSPGI